MTHRNYPKLGETVYHERLGNGLNIYVNPRPEFKTSYAFFAVKYGSIDTRFCAGGHWQDTPYGVAHFLEHKMFDTKEGNALQILSAGGASPNAFTSFALTGYHFEAAERFYENLMVLLSFVSVPYFTQKSVDKEQGIIAQEIKMYEDDPGMAAYFGMLGGLYVNHPVRIPIAGTVESISRITADTLYACHRAFYTPANMVLCAAGKVDVETVCALAEEGLPGSRGGDTQRDYGGEGPMEAVRRDVRRRMEVSTPLFQIGWKREPCPEGEDYLRQEFIGDLACEALLGSSSPLYDRLYREGLINRSFSYSGEAYPGCAWLCAGGESRDPDRVADAIEEEAARIGREGVDEGLFRRLKKASYGERVRSLNSLEHVCVSLAEGCFTGSDPFLIPEAFDGISKEDLEACIAAVVRPDRRSLSVILPKEEEK